MAMSVGHVGWGLLAYRKPLAAWLRDGPIDSVGDGLFQPEHSQDARAAAFWFLFAAPMIGVCGSLVEAAERRGDRPALQGAGRALIAFGTVSAAIIPRSGFPAVPLVGYWLIRRGRAL
jgi:Family of unknown function (DUF6463)